MTSPAHALRIDGRAVEPRGPVPLQPADPLTGAATRPALHGGGAEDFEACVDAAVRAATGWQNTSPTERAATLRRIADRLEEDTEGLADTTTAETGKRLVEARAEVAFSARYFRWYADVVAADGTAVGTSDAALRQLATSRPLGLVLVVTPWNFPLSIPARKLAPLLAAGCTAVFKPSEVAPVTSLRFAELIEQELPPGTVNTILGDPSSLGTEMLDDERIRGVTFTGSTRVGRLFARQAARRFQRSVLELGGNAPFIVLEDADVDAAAACLQVAKYRNNGQSCIAANQVYAHRAVADELFERTTQSARTLIVGDPRRDEVELGPLALPSDPQRLAGLARTLEEDGAEVVTATLDPTLPGGHFAPPTVARAAAPGGPAWEVEAFGPVLLFQSFDDPAEVVASVNAGRAGLAAYVCTSDVHRGARLGAALEVGIVGVNTATPNDPSLPFGGTKESGWGREGGRAGLVAFTEPQMFALADQQPPA